MDSTTFNMRFSKSTSAYVPIQCENAGKSNLDKYPWIDCGDLHQTIRTSCKNLRPPPGIHSYISMQSAGFEYIKRENTARCRTCGLEVSDFRSDIKPFAIHKQRSPSCPFVLSNLPSSIIVTPVTNNPSSISSALAHEEQPLKRLKTDTTVTRSLPNILVEVDSLKQVRKRGFSHWPHRSSPSASQMIEAGFFNCNVGDRVICIYCDIICQQWTLNSDDPCEAHKILSPKCSYVIAMLITSSTSSISIINGASASVDPIRSQAIVHTAAFTPKYNEIPQRYESFATWPNENLPPVDDLVKAGFFFSGTKTIVTCFYCNGSLQNWGADDNPMIEHARWFPQCAYAKQLCGVELHRKIQESKRVQQERARRNNTDNQFTIGTGNSNVGRLLIPDESTLSRLVAARLDLPISQSLLDRNFKLSIIKRCWEDQLRLKHEDFASDCDLFMACTILQKQIECIDGKKENILVPSVAIKQIQEKKQAEARAREQVASRSPPNNSSERNDLEVETSSIESSTTETNTQASKNNTENIRNTKPSASEASVRTSEDDASPVNPCVLCLTEEKRLACIPCGHLATCVPCGHSLRSCPICRREIDAFVRLYL